MPPTLTHLALHVRDVEGCVAFYREYCAMKEVHRRGEAGERTVWLAEAGRENEFVIVLIDGGPGHQQAEADFSHIGIAVAERAEVDAIARRARAAGCLAWPPREEAYPVGYYCGVRDPGGHIVEFSFGQPLGPAASGG